MRTVVAITMVLCCAMGLPSLAFAAPPAGRARAPAQAETATRRAPTAAYLIQGLLAGGITGAAGGYLHEHEGNDYLTEAKWKRVGLWGGTGAAAGLTLGILCVANDRGDKQRRDLTGFTLTSSLMGGTFFGVAVGATAGALYTNSTEGKERVGYGAALGGAIGAGFGFLVALIEMPRAANEDRRRITPTATSMRDGRNRSVWMLGASGQF